MIMRSFKSPSPQTPFAPVYFYPWCEERIEGINYKKIAKIILKKEPEFLKKFKPFKRTSEQSKDGYTGLGDKSLTARYYSYNIFDIDPSIQALVPKILSLHKKFLTALNIIHPSKIIIKGWANVLRKGESVQAHIHDVSPDAYLEGNIPIQCDDTSTFYINPINQINDPEIAETKNEVGLLTLFPSVIPHYTNKHTSSKERITIAFGLKYL